MLQVLHGVSDSQKDHGSREPEGPDSPACVQAAHRRIAQFNVQHDQVGAGLLRFVDSLVASSAASTQRKPLSSRAGLMNERICGLSSTSIMVGVGSCGIVSSRIVLKTGEAER